MRTEKLMETLNDAFASKRLGKRNSSSNPFFAKNENITKQGGLSLTIWQADITLNVQRTAHRRMTNLFSDPQQ
ncbi:hypothetical protein N9C22_02425 [Paracoccaceae bacterium]|nr:hypothetical protein [Paracoccaceae bacterium]